MKTRLGEIPLTDNTIAIRPADFERQESDWLCVQVLDGNTFIIGHLTVTMREGAPIWAMKPLQTHTYNEAKVAFKSAMLDFNRRELSI